MIYLILVQPFEHASLNYIETFNELCIMLASYHLLFFTDFTPDPVFQNEMGWSLIAITTLNIMVNMIVMIKATLSKVKFTCLKLRYNYHMQQLEKRR